MNSLKSYICTKDDENQRLDYVLSCLMPELGIRARRRLCEQGSVFLNNKKSLASKKVRCGNVITIQEKYSFEHDNTNNHDFSQLLQNITILHETEDFAAITKPSQMHSARISGKILTSPDLREVSVETLLPYVFQGKKTILLNRLDYVTSGILLLAFSQENKEKWQILQDKKDTRKFYLAVTEGKFRGNFDSKVDKMPLKDVENIPQKISMRANAIRISGKIVLKKYQKVRVDTSKKGSRITYVYPIAYCKQNPKISPTMENSTPSYISLVLCEIQKGSRHQIRAHLASIGHPLLGDIKYFASESYSFEQLHSLDIFSEQAKLYCNDMLNQEHTIKETQKKREEKHVITGTESFLLHHIKIQFTDFEALSLPFYFNKLPQNIQKNILDYME